MFVRANSGDGGGKLKQGTITVANYSTGATINVDFEPKWINFIVTTPNNAKGWYSSDRQKVISDNYAFGVWAASSVTTSADYTPVAASGSNYTVTFKLYSQNWNGSTVDYTIVG